MPRRKVLRVALAAPLALAALALSRPWALLPAAFAAGGPGRRPPAGAPEALRREGDLGALSEGAPTRSAWKRIPSAVPAAEAEPSVQAADLLQSARDSLGAVLAQLCALALGCLLGISAAFADVATDVENVEACWGFIKRNYYDQTFNGQDWEGLHEKYLARARRGEGAGKLTREMVGSLGDRFSRVIDAAAFERLMAYDPLGIGVVLARNEGGEVIVSSPPFAGTAAAKAGLRQGDIVASVDGSSFANESLFGVMDRVAQADSPQVKLALRRGTASEPSASWEETLPRARQSAPQTKVDFGVVKATGPGDHKVGYLRMKTFGARSALDMADALDKLRKDGADELVLDLRGNLGGSFQAALEIAALFLQPGSVATHVQTPASGDKALKVNANALGAKEPLVLLVDQQSASASEVLAAALRGNCRAPLLGSRTYGKSAVQGVFGLPNREAIALTVANYRGPNDLTIGGGLPPDAEGPTGPLARAAAATGYSMEIGPSDYAGIDFDSGRDGSLRTCVVEKGS